MARDTAGGFSGRFNPDPREFDPRKCCRIFFDAHDGSAFTPAVSGSVRHMNWFRGASGTLTNTMLYDSRVGNFLRLTSAATTQASRSWISDRVAAVQPALIAGLAEMDVSAMVRMPALAEGVGPCVGFMAAHGSPGELMYNSIMFECYQPSGRCPTWIACMNVNNASTATPISTRVDTGISVLDWHELKVWVNKEATYAVWTIDNSVVREERNPLLFPTWANQVRNGETAADVVASTVGLQGACRVRSNDAATNEQGSLDVSWFRYRYFREYA